MSFFFFFENVGGIRDWPRGDFVTGFTRCMLQYNETSNIIPYDYFVFADEK